MTARTLGIVAVLAAACGPSGDPLDVRYTLSHGPENACRIGANGPFATSCNDIPMTCDSVVMLRIVNPDPAQPERYVEECLPIPQDNLETLCALTRVAFSGEGRMPTDRVEVQLAIYARDDLATDDATGNPICPATVEFTASGFASIENPIHPALSGRAYADGYDREVVVELGCHDMEIIDSDDCRNEDEIDVTASVIDFETQVSVSSGTADGLLVRAGEPRLSDFEWIIDSTSSVELTLDSAGPVPFWIRRDIPIGPDPGQVEFAQHQCIQVLEDPPVATTLTCYVPPQTLPDEIDLVGVRVADTTLDFVLGAMGLPEFPSDCASADCGMVLGIVVDETGQAVEGAIVSDSSSLSPAFVQYVTEDGMLTTTGTSTRGIFVSRNAAMLDDAGFPNGWSVVGTTFMQLNNPVGGEVSNRLTVVVIRVRR